jgi:hypothetical protein
MKNSWVALGMALALGVSVELSGCGGGSASGAAAVSSGAVTRTYNATASVGDFLTIQVDASAHTITYHNHTNGDSGTVGYTVSPDGYYQVTDPHGVVLDAVEIPGTGFVLTADHTGPNHDTRSLITAVESQGITKATVANQHYNYMQFRTSFGGIEVGEVNIDGASNISHDGYSASIEQFQSLANSFDSGSISSANLTEDGTGTYLSTAGDQGGTVTIFGTSNGNFIVDNPNGAIIGVKQAPSKDFAPSNAGTYHGLVYFKTNCQSGPGGEVGTPGSGRIDASVTAAGDVTITTGEGQTVAAGTLTPVEDAPYLYGGSPSLQGPCHGLFALRTIANGNRQDLFVTFLNGSMLIGEYSTATPLSNLAPYSYTYGVALR